MVVDGQERSCFDSHVTIVKRLESSAMAVSSARTSEWRRFLSGKNPATESD